MNIIVVILSVIISSAFGQVIDFGKCPDVQAVQNFNPDAFFGKWYEFERYLSILEIDQKCTSLTNTPNRNGSVDIVTQAVSKLSGAHLEFFSTGNLVECDLGEYDLYFHAQNSKIKYYVLATDYVNYATVFSCKNLGFNLHASFGWILSRCKNPTDDIISTAKMVLKKQNLSTATLVKVNQDC